METRYKNYRIEVYQTEIRRWRGAMTARTTIDVAKALIDDGDID
jgi:hypothetical protein